MIKVSQPDSCISTTFLNDYINFIFLFALHQHLMLILRHHINNPSPSPIAHALFLFFINPTASKNIQNIYSKVWMSLALFKYIYIYIYIIWNNRCITHTHTRSTKREPWKPKEKLNLNNDNLRVVSDNTLWVTHTVGTISIWRTLTRLCQGKGGRESPFPVFRPWIRIWE